MAGGSAAGLTFVFSLISFALVSDVFDEDYGASYGLLVTAWLLSGVVTGLAVFMRTKAGQSSGATS